MIRNTLIGAAFFIMISTATYAHQAPSGWTYGYGMLCGENDCEPVNVLTDDKGNFAILKNGQK